MPPTPDYLKLLPKEALEYFRQKVAVPTENWKQFEAEQHDFAYTIAGLTRADLLESMRWLIEQAIAEGYSFETFNKQFKRLVGRRGWTPDPLPAGPSDWRMRIIFETPIRRSYGAGRLRQMRDPEVLNKRPYWLWKHGDSPSPRMHHLDLHNQVFRADDPFWDMAYPPCGYGCKCRAFSIGDRHLAARGLSVGMPPDPSTVAQKGFRRAPGTTPEAERQEVLDQGISRLSPALAEEVRKDMKDKGLMGGDRQDALERLDDRRIWVDDKSVENGGYYRRQKDAKTPVKISPFVSKQEMAGMSKVFDPRHTDGVNRSFFVEDKHQKRRVLKVARPHEIAAEVLVAEMGTSIGAKVNQVRIVPQAPNLIRSQGRGASLHDLVPGMPCSKIRQGANARMSLSLGGTPTQNRDAFGRALQRPDLAKIMALDLFTGNTDRHSGNLFYDPKKGYHGIDHGYAFMDTTASDMDFSLHNCGEAELQALTMGRTKNLKVLVSSLEKLTQQNSPESIANRLKLYVKAASSGGFSQSSEEQADIQDRQTISERKIQSNHAKSLDLIKLLKPLTEKDDRQDSERLDDRRIWVEDRSVENGGYYRRQKDAKTPPKISPFVSKQEIAGLVRVDDARHSNGMNDSFFVENHRGERQVIKTAETPYETAAEVLVAEMAEAIGAKVNRVRIVPSRSHLVESNGVGGSLHDLVPGESCKLIPKGKKGRLTDLRIGFGPDDDKYALKNALEHPDTAKILALDILTGNGDRHPGNLFYDPKKGYHGIDHGHAFTGSTASGLHDSIEHLSDEEVQTLVAGNTKNLKVMVSSLEKLTKKNTPESIINRLKLYTNAASSGAFNRSQGPGGSAMQAKLMYDKLQTREYYIKKNHERSLQLIKKLKPYTIEAKPQLPKTDDHI